MVSANALSPRAPVRRQRLWDQIGDLNDGGFLVHRNPKESDDEPEILRHSNRQFSHIGADAGQAGTATTRSPRPSTSFTRPRSIHRRGSWRSFEAAEFAILVRVDRFNSSRMARANRLYPARSSRRTHLCSTIATNSSKKRRNRKLPWVAFQSVRSLQSSRSKLLCCVRLRLRKILLIRA